MNRETFVCLRTEVILHTPTSQNAAVVFRELFFLLLNKREQSEREIRHLISEPKKERIN